MTMTYVERPILRSEHAKHVCNVCGRASEETICEACRVNVRAEALVMKKHKDKGEA
jgi:recombinational DNA repair protein RecR